MPEGSAGESVTFGFEPAQPGHVLENLARSIGPIPRVLLPETGADDTALSVAEPSTDEMPAPAERGDRYQLSGEIARGGMGAVLRGRDRDLGRDLAVKVLLESHEDKPELITLARDCLAVEPEDRPECEDVKRYRPCCGVVRADRASTLGGSHSERVRRSSRCQSYVDERARDPLGECFAILGIDEFAQAALVGDLQPGDRPPGEDPV